MAIFALTVSASAADVYKHRHHPRAVVYAEPLPPFQAPDPVLFAAPGFAVTVRPWLTQPANPFTDPVEFGLQFVPRVRLGY
jgi:hypothetical protein